MTVSSSRRHLQMWQLPCLGIEPEALDCCGSGTGLSTLVLESRSSECSCTLEGQGKKYLTVPAWGLEPKEESIIALFLSAWGHDLWCLMVLVTALLFFPGLSPGYIGFNFTPGSAPAACHWYSYCWVRSPLVYSFSLLFFSSLPSPLTCPSLPPLLHSSLPFSSLFSLGYSLNCSTNDENQE
jgi:hypothetical protein